ncbi:unnamed protein product [Mycena citricolor]|uniref:Uncharacterized protein n=1 Tax=Mycena citricolor TaxID=2018698 RepID=A0AAD2H1C3_9AGAR|nr:unnamed protein product [Mycena citricolor]
MFLSSPIGGEEDVQRRNENDTRDQLKARALDAHVGYWSQFRESISMNALARDSVWAGTTHMLFFRRAAEWGGRFLSSGLSALGPERERMIMDQVTGSFSMGSTKVFWLLKRIFAPISVVKSMVVWHCRM